MDANWGKMAMMLVVLLLLGLVLIIVASVSFGVILIVNGVKAIKAGRKTAGTITVIIGVCVIAGMAVWLVTNIIFPTYGLLSQY